MRARSRALLGEIGFEVAAARGRRPGDFKAGLQRLQASLARATPRCSTTPATASSITASTSCCRPTSASTPRPAARALALGQPDHRRDRARQRRHQHRDPRFLPQQSVRRVPDAFGNGLATIERGAGETLIAYATAAGEAALDGAGGNSPFTAALVTTLDRPRIEIFDLFRQVRGRVREATDGLQLPWVSSSLEREFYFEHAARSRHGRAAGSARAAGHHGRERALERDPRQHRSRRFRGLPARLPRLGHGALGRGPPARVWSAAAPRPTPCACRGPPRRRCRHARELRHRLRSGRRRRSGPAARGARGAHRRAQHAPGDPHLRAGPDARSRQPAPAVPARPRARRRRALRRGAPLLRAGGEPGLRRGDEQPRLHLPDRARRAQGPRDLGASTTARRRCAATTAAASASRAPTARAGASSARWSMRAAGSSCRSRTTGRTRWTTSRCTIARASASSRTSARPSTSTARRRSRPDRGDGQPRHDVRPRASTSRRTRSRPTDGSGWPRISATGTAPSTSRSPIWPATASRRTRPRRSACSSSPRRAAIRSPTPRSARCTAPASACRSILEEALFRYRIASRLGDAKGGRLLDELRPEVAPRTALAADARAERWLRLNGS